MAKNSKASSSAAARRFPRGVFLGFAALAAVAVLLITWLGEAPQNRSARENAKALIGGPFTLVTHKGETVTEQTYKGKYMLIYFGYTFCPDVCPTELQAMTSALDLVPENVRQKIAPLFITVDPERDTVEIMAQYVPLFHEALTGLTGSREQVDAVKKAYRVYAVKTEETDASEYLVDHTSLIYLMDKNGDYLSHFSYGTPADQIAARLAKLVR
ncbi:SCO family protein [Luteithermobacter gelatinilyticus]|uniref:SCO family protein n=1 Tax=Luteithermobacter gelatinilyticus TaxID=2582913 RepID=UPI001106FC19|nr:SCO family protein [Luteithermobacter gelatinilyticus]